MELKPREKIEKIETAEIKECLYSVDSIKRTVHLAFHGLFFY